MQTHTHPISGVVIQGVRMPAGTTIRETDRYDSSTGKWSSGFSAAGLVIQPGCATVWVRQPGPLSENARVLLGYLNLRGGDLYGCVALRDGKHYVVPGPHWNWDGRFDLKVVTHPECLQELVDHGYLALDRRPVFKGNSDYSTARPDGMNDTYLLTEEGKKKGVEILSN